MVIPEVVAAAGRDRGAFGVNMFWSSRMARNVSAESLGFVMVTVSRPDTMPVTGSRRVSIE